MASNILPSGSETINCSPIGFDLMAGKFTNIGWHALLPALKASAPSVNLDAAVNRAAIWLVANPAKRPAGNHAPFLSAWFAREQRQELACA